MSNLVYKIPCRGNDNENCNKVYVGTTKNKLKTRLAGHKPDHKYNKTTIYCFGEQLSSSKYFKQLSQLSLNLYYLNNWKYFKVINDYFLKS